MRHDEDRIVLCIRIVSENGTDETNVKELFINVPSHRRIPKPHVGVGRKRWNSAYP